MTASSEQVPSPAPRTGEGWLWTVRILVVLAIVFIVALILVSWLSALSDRTILWGLLWALIPALPYLWILVRLGGKARQKGLALSVVIGAWAFLSGVLILGIVAKETANPCRSNPLNPLLLPIAGLFALLQAALVPVAVKTNYVLQRATDERWTLGREILKRALYLGLPLLLLVVIVLPNLFRWRDMETGFAPPVRNLRTINTAQITYASMYNTGYSANLASLAPPAAGAQPSATAAGLIGSVLAGGFTMGYRFEYKPGPAEKGRIESYTVTARPLKYATCGYNSYFSDESGVIRSTGENRPPTAQDPPLAG